MSRANADYPQEPVAGEWWLPSDRDESRVGALTYAPRERPKLHLLSGWSTQGVAWGESVEREVVHGQSTQLEAMTLLRNRDREGRTRIGGASSGHNRDIVGALLVFGAHTEALEEIEMGQLTLQHTCGPVAVHRNGIGSMERFENHPDGGGFDASFDDVAAVSVVVDNTEVQLAVNATLGAAQTTSRGVEIDLRATPTFNIRPGGGAPADFESLWVNYAKPLNVLLRFAADIDGGWHRVAFRNRADDHPRLLRIHHNEVVDPDEHDIPDRHEHGFHLDCVGYEELIPSWLDLNRKFGESIGACLEGCFARWGAEQIRLLAVGLEGLSDIAEEHERRFDDEQRNIVKRALSACEGLDPEARGAAVSELSRITLKARLRSLVGEIEASGVTVPSVIGDHLDDIRMFRNQFSHPDPRADIDGPRLTRAIAAAKGLFRAAVISQLSFAEDRREHLVEQALERSAKRITLFSD